MCSTIAGLGRGIYASTYINSYGSSDSSSFVIRHTIPLKVLFPLTLTETFYIQYMYLKQECVYHVEHSTSLLQCFNTLRIQCLLTILIDSKHIGGTQGFLLFSKPKTRELIHCWLNRQRERFVSERDQRAMARFGKHVSPICNFKYFGKKHNMNFLGSSSFTDVQ